MDEKAQFFYLKPLPLYEVEVPYDNFIDGTSNITIEKPPLQLVLDIRGREEEFTLATHGFEYHKRALPAVRWEDEDDIKKVYVEDLKICEVLGSPGARFLCIPGCAGPTNCFLPFWYMLSPLGVLEWLRRELGQEETTEIVNNYRVRVIKYVPLLFPAALKCVRGQLSIRVISIWRPLVDVVKDVPLAMCDVRTVKPSDLVGSAHVSGDYVRRNYQVKYSQEFQFYYLSRMVKEELCVFMVFDSSGVGEERIRTPPHSAFWHSKQWRSDKHPRESIEVRLLVLSPLE
ncbi:hypothetical protein AYL99_10998 [Fonsecaea erecta]|uniref:Uncharacterized protein n=1 Tax=Fonsecaea erecta TaxID=1367422 RepID=A0A178Z482_9EURO|nr:hypothetical protein AYL99_10998 [Fonsecaea erecta]OAP54550.1 hypothetical protein AYL99_10998 [Fonsecaea erecta]